MIANQSGAPASPGPAGTGVTLQVAPIQEAGFVSRLAAFVIDVVIVSVSSFVFAALSSLILSFFGFSARDLRLEDPLSSMMALLQLIIVGLVGLAILLFIPAYFVIFWVLVGATPGKYVLGLKVLRAGKGRVTWVRAILRFAGYWIAALPLFLGFLWILLDNRRQGWHDKLANTIVAYTWEVPGSERAQHSPNDIKE